MAPSAATRLRRLDRLRPLLGLPPVQALLKYLVARRITGPNSHERESARSYVWGEAQNRAGRKVVARIETANGYDVTVEGALMAINFLLEEEPGLRQHANRVAHDASRPGTNRTSSSVKPASNCPPLRQ